LKKTIVVDASVVAKWFNNESLTDKALEVREAFIEGKIDLCAPEHLLYEVGNSIWKNKALSINDCIQAMDDLMNMSIELTRLDHAIAARAVKSARELLISYYDALYIQLSIDRLVPLLSANENLLSKTKGTTNAYHLRDFS
jgi:predicted nucleic acid-binding protein